MIRLSLAETFEQARLLVPARYWAFAARTVTKGRRTITQGIAWQQGWNPDAIMERRSARLTGSGSFYWACSLTCVAAAKRAMRDDSTIHQIKIETISGVEVARLYRSEVSK